MHRRAGRGRGELVSDRGGSYGHHLNTQSKGEANRKRGLTSPTMAARLQFANGRATLGPPDSRTVELFEQLAAEGARDEGGARRGRGGVARGAHLLRRDGWFE